MTESVQGRPERLAALVKEYADERVGAIWGYEDGASVRATLSRFAKWLEHRGVSLPDSGDAPRTHVKEAIEAVERLRGRAPFATGTNYLFDLDLIELALRIQGEADQ